MTHDTPPNTHTPHPHIWGDMKKTSPMEGEVFFTGDTQTDIHTYGHRDSMTESAQWADSVKMYRKYMKKYRKVPGKYLGSTKQGPGKNMKVRQIFSKVQNKYRKSFQTVPGRHWKGL